MKVRRGRARYLIGLGALLGVLAFAVGCGGSSEEAATSAQTSPARSTLTIGLDSSGTSLNPALNGNGGPAQISSLSNAPLVHQQPDGSFTPGLATSWRYVGSGNKVFQLTLRRDARFSDGTPVTPEAVKTWLEYFAKAAGPTSGLVSIASIRTIGDSTVELRLAKPHPNMPFVLSENINWGAVSSPKAVANPRLLGTQTYGAGPYTVVPEESVAGDHYTFVPNRFFYDKSQIHFRKVVVRIITSPTTMLQAAKTGQVDVAVGDATTADAAAAAGLNVLSVKGRTNGLFFVDRAGTLVKALADVRVRQALNYAVDREAITKALAGRYGTPSSELLTTDAFVADYEDHYPYDPAKAKALLAEAGYEKGFSFKVVDPGYAGQFGTPLTQAIAKYLDAVGVKLDVVTRATNNDYGRAALSGEYSSIQLSSNSSPMAQKYDFFLVKDGVLNQHGWSDPVVDKLRAEAVAAEDPTPYWNRMLERTVTEAYFVPIMSGHLIWYVDKGIKGIEMTPQAPLPWPTNWSAE